MNELQLELLKLWKQVKPILDDNNIKYWAIGGTAIGAFRNQGFIPWDDDMDICIIEEQIPLFKEKLKEVGLESESEYLKFNPYPFSKAFGNACITSFGEKDKIYIDIFPGHLERKWSKLGWLAFRTRDNLLYTKSKLMKNWVKGSDGKGIYFGLLIAKWCLCWLPSRYLIYKQNRALSRKRIIPGANKDIRYSYFLDMDKPFNISQTKEIKFEDTKIVVNTSFGKDMENVFGDIMIKPKENKLINHNIKIRK